jgi:serine/threonine protein kinase
MSLERILGKEYSYSSDIWSLGLIVYELATGVFPYVFSKIYLEHVDVISEQDEPNLPDNGEFSEDLQDFIKRCLKKNPDERFSVFELLDHPWIITENQQDYNLVSWLDTLFNKMETN